MSNHGALTLWQGGTCLGSGLAGLLPLQSRFYSFLMSLEYLPFAAATPSNLNIMWRLS